MRAPKSISLVRRWLGFRERLVDHRQIPERYFSPHTQWMFNGKVAMVTWGDIETLTIIENKALFQAETRMFDCTNTVHVSVI